MEKYQKISAAELKQYKKRSLFQEVWRNYKKNPSAMIGLIIVILIILLALFAQIYYD